MVMLFTSPLFVVMALQTSFRDCIQVDMPLCIIAERLSARQLIVQRSHIASVYIYIYMYIYIYICIYIYIYVYIYISVTL